MALLQCKSMSSKAIAILTAITPEARAIAQTLGMECPAPDRPVRSRIESLMVSLHVIGIGAKGLAALKLQERPSWLVMAGLAGALDPSLRIGDVIVDDCPPELREIGGFRCGPIATHDRVVATPAEKARLRNDSGALAVEMENAVARDWAIRRNIPFLAIRSISDRSDQSVDAALLGCVDSWGKPQPISLIGYLLRNPFRISHLIRLRHDSSQAAASLGAAVKALVGHCAALVSRESIAPT